MISFNNIIIQLIIILSIISKIRLESERKKYKITDEIEDLINNYHKRS